MPSTVHTADSWLAEAESPWVGLLREAVANGTVELALHGYEHRRNTARGHRPGEFGGQAADWQRGAIRAGRDALAAALGQAPRVFVPPWNSWDAATADALEEMGFDWCSSDLHHADYRDGAVRLVPQSTGDPDELLALLRSGTTLPSGTVLVLTTHPFDFVGTGGQRYFAAMEQLLRQVDEDPDWACVGLADLPHAPLASWHERFRAAVAWHGLGEVARDLYGAAWLAPTTVRAYQPADSYAVRTGVWRIVIGGVLVVSFGSALVAGRWMARWLASRRLLVALLAGVATLGLLVLVMGAASIRANGYHVRGVRWQAMAVAAGMALGLGKRGRHNTHATSRWALARVRGRVTWVWHVTRSRVLWGRRLHRLGHRSVLCRCMQANNPRAVSVGDGVVVLEDWILADLRPEEGCCPKIVIGDGCTIMYRFQCNAAESVHIGRNVLIAGNVFISDSDHVLEPGVPITRSSKYRTRPVRIEDNCWLGQNAVILKGVTVGHDSIVGANSVVTRDVPPLSIVAGNPARVIRKIEPQDRAGGADGFAIAAAGGEVAAELRGRQTSV